MTAAAKRAHWNCNRATKKDGRIGNTNPVAARWPGLRIESFVFLKNSLELVVGEGRYVVIVNAGHGFRGNHAVDDGFFGSLHDSGKHRIERLVGEHFYLHRARGGSCSRICG